MISFGHQKLLRFRTSHLPFASAKPHACEHLAMNCVVALSDLICFLQPEVISLIVAASQSLQKPVLEEDVHLGSVAVTHSLHLQRVSGAR